MDEERAQGRRKKLLSSIVIVLMVASVIGFYFGSSDEGTVQRYKGIKFITTPQGVFATIEGVRYGFNSLPSQVEAIPSASVGSMLRSPFLFVTYEPQSNYSQGFAAMQYYFSELFSKQFNTYVLSGITSNASFSFPIVTCANATEAEPVLRLVENNETEIMLAGSCITASAKSMDDVYRLQDKLVLLALGVVDK